MRRLAIGLAAAIIFVASAASCNGCGGGGDQDAGQDTSNDATDASTEQDIIGDDDPSDAPSDDGLDTTSGDGPDAVSDAYHCWDTYDLRYDTSAWDVVTFSPDRPGRDCGPGCRQVSFAEHDVWNPNYEVWGNYLVINTMNDGSPVTKRVILIDLSSMIHYIISEAVEGPEDEVNAWAEIHADTLLYVHRRDWLPASLRQFDVYTGEETTLIPYDAPYHISGHTQMDCNYIVYEDQHDTYEVWLILFDLNSGERNPIPTITGNGIEPSIHGGRVAFQDNYGGFTNLGVYDIASGSVIWSLEGAWDKYAPQIYGDTVVWGDARNGGRISNPTHGDIYMVDLSTGIESPVCDHPAAQGDASIWDNWVAWDDYRNDPLHPNDPVAATEDYVYAKNLVTGVEVQVSSMPGWEWETRVFEGRVYFLAFDDADILSVFEVVLPE